MHLDRKGAAVTGSYVYVAVGRPIRLDGTLDAAGALGLTERADGKITGAFRLRARDDGLVGEWTDPAGEKTITVKLGKGAPWVVRVVDAGAPVTDNRDARGHAHRRDRRKGRRPGRTRSRQRLLRRRLARGHFLACRGEGRRPGYAAPRFLQGRRRNDHHDGRVRSAPPQERRHCVPRATRRHRVGDDRSWRLP